MKKIREMKENPIMRNLLVGGGIIAVLLLLGLLSKLGAWLLKSLTSNLLVIILIIAACAVLFGIFEMKKLPVCKKEKKQKNSSQNGLDI